MLLQHARVPIRQLHPSPKTESSATPNPRVLLYKLYLLLDLPVLYSHLLSQPVSVSSRYRNLCSYIKE